MMDKQSPLILLHRFQSLFALLAIAFGSSHQPVRAADENIITNSNGLVVEERPGWLEDEVLQLADWEQSTDPVNGVRMFLMSTQTNYATPEPEFYYRAVIQLVNISSLSGQSTVSLSYIPKYQTYTVTGLNIIRGSEIIDVREKAIVRFNQLEAPIGSDQFESPKQVMIFVPGLRTEDIVDFSYIVRGAQEAFQDTISGSFDHGANFPVGRFYTRVLVPKGLKLHIFGINSPAEPERYDNAGGYDEYRWVEDKINPSAIEENAPSWYSSFPVTYYSNFNSWADVRKWAESLFISHAEPDPELVSLANELTEGLVTETEKLRAVLTFMQREIRNVGMELGRNGFRPFPTTIVLERRFGDCKDKSNLFLDILRALNIRAVPVLTNVMERRWMMTDFPTPTAFNHVFVHAVADGKEYWVDPTMPIFGKDDAKLDYVNFGYGLKLDGAATNLATIPEDPYGLAGEKYNIVIFPTDPRIRNEIRVNFRQYLTDDEAVYFRMQRDRVGEEKHDEFIKEFVATFFRGDSIELKGEADILDDFQDNELDVSAGYIVHKPWQLDDKKKFYTFWIYSQLVRQNLVSFEKTEDRIAPAMLIYPLDIEESFKVYMPGWKFDDIDETIDSRFHHFNRKVWYNDDYLNITYNYRTNEKFIPTAEVSLFNEDIKSIKDKLAYHIYFPNVKNEDSQFKPEMDPGLLKPEIEIPKVKIDFKSETGDRDDSD